MSEHVNGSIAQLPCIKVNFDPATQRVTLDFNPLEFKDWLFVRGILHAAQIAAEQKQQEAQIIAMQQQAMQAHAAQQQMSKLKLGR